MTHLSDRLLGHWADVSEGIGPDAIIPLLQNLNQAQSLIWEKIGDNHWVVLNFSGTHWKVWRGTEGPDGFTESSEYLTHEHAMHAYAREYWNYYKLARQEAIDGCEISPPGGDRVHRQTP